MTNINFPDSPTDGQVFGERKYNATKGVWEDYVLPGDTTSEDLLPEGISGSFQFQYLVIGGGGGGGGSYGGGGGGAGGYRSSVSGETSGQNSGIESSSVPLDNTITSFTVTVGAGGSEGLGDDIAPVSKGGDGENSILSNIVALGGGGGGGARQPNQPSGSFVGSSGGSGGGAGVSGSTPGSPGSGEPSQGFGGGSSVYLSSKQVCGGGGGASASGQNATDGNSGDGGNGISSSITGTSIARAGGGGGAGRWDLGVSTSVGGSGGGGDSGNNSTYGEDGQANTGGGGGGGGQSSSIGGYNGNGGLNGGKGGSGIVILKYANTNSLTIDPGLVSTTDDTTVPGYKITSFTSGTGIVSISLYNY